MILERPMTAKAVSMTLNISQATLLKLAKREENPLPCIRIGSHYRFFWSDIVKFFNITPDKIVHSTPQPTDTQMSNTTTE